MSKVLIFANDNSTLYNFRRELLTRLVSEGLEVVVALPAHPRNQAFADLGCTVIETPVSRFGTNPVTELATLARFVKVVRRTRPDVILTYTAKPNIYGGLAAQVCRVPYVSTVTGLGVAFQSKGALQGVSASLQRLAFRKAHKVFFQNSDNLATFQDLSIIRGQAEVLPGSGVNLQLHRLEPYAADDGVTRFITVSRIRRDKGFDELFEAIRRLCSSRDDLHFDIVGWYEDDRYRSLVEEMRACFPVTFHDEVSQQRVHELISASHALIHPSHHEGMANVILEASAAGVPCIASDIPGCREAIDHGATGLLHPVQQVAAMVEAIEEFLALDWAARRSMGLAARAKVETDFDREQVVGRYLVEVGDAISSTGGKALSR